MEELVPGLVLTTPIKHKEACKLYALKPSDPLEEAVTFFKSVENSQPDTKEVV